MLIHKMDRSHRGTQANIPSLYFPQIHKAPWAQGHVLCRPGRPGRLRANPTWVKPDNEMEFGRAEGYPVQKAHHSRISRLGEAQGAKSAHKTRQLAALLHGGLDSPPSPVRSASLLAPTTGLPRALASHAGKLAEAGAAKRRAKFLLISYEWGESVCRTHC